MARRELMAADALVAVASRVVAGLPLANMTASLAGARFDANIILHHDAITGTMCVSSEGCIAGGQMGGDHAVLADYMRLLDSSMATAHQVGSTALAALMANGDSSPALLELGDPAIARALQRGQRVAVVLVNAELHTRTSVIRLSLPVTAVSFTDAKGKSIPSQVFIVARKRVYLG